MRIPLLAALLLACPALADDDKAKKVAEQKAAALAAWTAFDSGEGATLETELFIVVAPKAREKALKSIAATLARYHDAAVKALALDLKDAYPGKITVYLLPEPASMASFARRVEKRRPEAGETGSFLAGDDKVHVAAAPSRGGTPAETRAGEMVAGLLLARKAGVRTPLPEWLAQGFPRAATYRVSPSDKAVLAEKKKARAFARKKAAKDIYDASLDADEAVPLHASLAEYMAYAGGRARFPKFVVSFKPGEGMTARTTTQAMEAAGINAANLDKAWKTWAGK